MTRKLTEIGWSYGLDLAALHTPHADCVCLPLGQLDTRIIERLEASKFDHAPVINDGNCIVGMLRTSDARALAQGGQSLEVDTPLVIRRTIESEPTIKKLLDVFRTDGAAVVVTPSGDSVGLVTIADLNRHGFRSYLYEVLAELEGDMAAFLEQQCPEHWEWLKRLGEDKQARIIGYWEISKRKNVDIGPVAATVLSELLNILASLESLRSKLRFPSRKQFERECRSSSIIDIRNRVMHPVRPLIINQSDINNLKEALSGAFLLAEKLRTVGI